MEFLYQMDVEINDFFVQFYQGKIGFSENKTRLNIVYLT